MQTSALYNRLRGEEKEEPKSVVRVSPLAFMQLLPKQFSTAMAIKLGEEMGIKHRTVNKHLYTLKLKGYIVSVRQGVYCKVSRNNRRIAHAA